jgi:hypothetical protein
METTRADMFQTKQISSMKNETCDLCTNQQKLINKMETLYRLAVRNNFDLSLEESFDTCWEEF